MTLLHGALCLLLAAAAAGSDRELVGIYADRGGRAELGSGFLISAQGHVLTCYHVIHGAEKLTVYWDGHRFDRVVIESWAPDFDLAKLRLDGYDGATPHLVVDTRMIGNDRQPSGRQVLGYIHGGSSYQFGYELPRQGLEGGPFDYSERIRSVRGQRIFRRAKMRLLPLSTKLYKGMSGGPVLTDDGVVGVATGAYSEGGTVAWAIPLEYLRELKPIGKRPEQIRRWPPQTMLRLGWKALLKSFAVDEDAESVTQEFVTEVRSLAEVYERLRGYAVSARSSSGDAIRRYADLRRAPVDGCPAARLTRHYLLAVEMLREAVTGGVGDAFIDRGKVNKRLDTATEKLYTAVKRHDLSDEALGERARTIRSYAADLNATEHSRAALNVGAGELLEAIGAIDDAVAAVEQGIGKTGSCSVQWARLSKLDRGVRWIDRTLGYLASGEVVEQQMRELRRYRALAGVAEVVIYGELRR